MIVALLFKSFAGGGVEKVFVDLANEFSRRGINVRVIVLSGHGPVRKRLDGQVKVIDLNVSRVSRALPSIIRTFRRHHDWPFIVGPGCFNLVASLAHRFAPIKKLVLTEHTNVTAAAGLEEAWQVRFRPYVLRWGYSNADKIVAVSQQSADDLETLVGRSVSRIYNPVIGEDLMPPSGNGLSFPWKGGPHFIVSSVGRLARAKRHDVLLHAFSRFAATHDDARLVIFGEGELRSSLEQLTVDLGLHDRVWLPGYVDVPQHYVAKSAVFACTSEREGLGNALVEAMALGVPIVSTDYRSGAREILAAGKFGTLCPVGDVGAIASALDEVYEGRYSRDRAPQRHIEQFTISYAADRYLELLDYA